MKEALLEISYLIGAVTFIFGLKMMGNAKTARRGNTYATIGMTVAIVGTIIFFEGEYHAVTMSLIFIAIALGSIIGLYTAKRVKMTKMPELVSMFNGMGGACAAMIGLMEYGNYIG